MSSLPTRPLRVALFGAGRVATAVATLLVRRGHTVHAVASPRRASAEAAAGRLGSTAVSTEELHGSEVILIGAPDAALADAAAGLGGAARGAVLVHFAGSVGVAPLRSATDALGLCALHPVQACPDVDTALRRLPGSAWGITCSENAVPWAHALVRDDLDGTPFEVAEEDRVLWHAAAVTTSNGISALMATGELILSAIGIDSPDEVLGPIAAGTVSNAREIGGGARALTGPIVRGEVDVIARQVEALGTRAPALLAGYVDTVRSIVAGARAAGRIEDSVASDIHGVLERR